MRTVFATMSKNAGETLELAGEIFKKHAVLDVRVPTGGGFKTTKGLTMTVAKWRELLSILPAAIEEFERQLADPDSEFAKVAEQ